MYSTPTMMPRFLRAAQEGIGLVVPWLSIVVAWLLPDQLPLGTPLVCGSCAPSVTRKTKGCVLVEALPLPTLVMVVFIELSATSICVPPEPRFEFILVSSSVARFAAAVLIGLL